jgi:hypothetical protein
MSTDIAFGLRRSAQMFAEDPKAARAAFREVAKANDPNPACPHCGKRHRTMTADDCLDRSMSEKTLQDRIRDRAKRRGWEIVHIGKAVPAYDEAGNPVWITSAPEGWPDLVLFKAKSARPVIAMELKRQKGEPTDAQLKWLALMNACGIPSAVIRPSDLREGRVNAILDL